MAQHVVGAEAAGDVAERIVGEELRLRAGSRVEQSAQLYADQLSRSLARRASEVELLGERQQVLDLQPDYPALIGLAVGVIAPCDPERDDTDAQFEVRAFIAGDGMPEDPATGSLNAGIAQWLLGAGLAPSRYRVSQGLSMGRAGRIEVQQLGDEVWIGGAAVTCIEGKFLAG